MPDATELLTRRADLAPSSADRDARTVEVIWSTGAPVRRRDMAGKYIERLSLAPEAVDLSLLQGASVLDAHRQSAVRDVLGSVQSAAVDGQRGTALIRFSARPEVEPLWQDVLSGILRHVSVGYSVEDWAESIENGARVLTAIRWTPHEISLVPTPADPGAHIRMETDMPDTIITTTAPSDTQSPRDIEDRFEEAAYTLRRLPEKDRPRGYGGSWPPVVQEVKHAYGYTPEAPLRVIPSAAAITRMEECFDWLMLIAPEDARIVWLRADGMRWRQVCIRAGVVRSNAWRRWAAALLTIAKKLNSQTKSKRKLSVPDEPGAIPRESVVNTPDNPQNTLNFRRDISSASEA